MRKVFFILVLIGGTTLLSLSSCSEIFDDIYDAAPSVTKTGYGFINVNEDKHTGTIYINSTVYNRWMYINLHSRTIDSLTISDNMADPDKWDFAVHRYDTKTNEGETLETGYTELETLIHSEMLSGTFEPDIWTEEKVAIDMSHMWEGKLLYAKTYYNAELSKWLNVSTATMPPTYTLSNKIYLLRLKDGTLAALKLSNYMDGVGNKGWLTIDYIYPLEF